MKRKLFLGLASLAIMAAAVTATVSSFTTTSSESDLISQNIEALTNDEDMGNYYCIIEHCCWVPGAYCYYFCNGGYWSSSNMLNC